MKDVLMAAISSQAPDILAIVGESMTPGEKAREALSEPFEELALLQAQHRLDPSEMFADLILSKEAEIAALVETERLIAEWATIEARQAFLSKLSAVAFTIGINVAQAALRG